MAKNLNIEFVKTYASVQNAEKAVAKVCTRPEDAELRYIVVPVVKGDKVRYGVLFLGVKAVEAGIHFHFNCAG